MTENTYSTLIIGAGAAGLAAARALFDAGQKIRVLEARDRIGGRIRTDSAWADFPLELGAEFIHGDQAATHELVRQAGLHTIPVVRMDNLWWAYDDQPAAPRSKLPPEVQKRINGLLEDYHRLPETDLPEDVSLADYLAHCGWDDKALVVADVLLAQTCCARLDSLSCEDNIREVRADQAGPGESRIQEGYGALLDWYSRDLPIEFNCPVDLIEWGKDGVTVHGGDEMYQARTGIITVPVSLLQRGTIKFAPDLPQDKRRAIRAFHVEPATKLVYRFREQVWDDELTFMAHTGLASRWWTPGYHRPTQTPLMSCYITADRARKIDAMSEAAALDAGLNDLSRLLGVPVETLREKCAASRRVSWAADLYARGGYAHLSAGTADSRPILARPEGKALFFAGEATAYDSDPQTVHGALESGWRAAREVMG
jgi:monoamine oxidase